MARLGWRRWWSASGMPALRTMAIEHWDPLGVYDDPLNAGIYDPYLDRVGRMLRRGKGPDEIARYLGDVRMKAFKRESNETMDELFADRVVAWYGLEAPEA